MTTCSTFVCTVALEHHLITHSLAGEGVYSRWQMNNASDIGLAWKDKARRKRKVALSGLGETKQELVSRPCSQSTESSCYYQCFVAPGFEWLTLRRHVRAAWIKHTGLNENKLHACAG